VNHAPAHIGIVGYGKIARDQHEAAIAATPGLSLAAIADPATRHASLPSHATLADMLAAQPELEAVALCQPPRARRSLPDGMCFWKSPLAPRWPRWSI
jgi:D-galactose 1-dehydrogenase